MFSNVHELGANVKQFHRAIGLSPSKMHRSGQRPSHCPPVYTAAARVVANERSAVTNSVGFSTCGRWPVAYQAESDLVRAVGPHYRRAVDEGRTLVHSALASVADITVAVNERELRLVLAPMSSPHRTRAIAALSQELTAAAVVFPGTRLRLVYAMAGFDQRAKRTKLNLGPLGPESRLGVMAPLRTARTSS